MVVELTTIVTESDKGTFIECDVIEDYPGFLTVARLRYVNGTEYRVTLSEFSEDSIGTILTLVPALRILTGIEETETFGNVCEAEETLIYWVIE